MSRTGNTRTLLIVLMALACLGFVAVVGLTATAAAGGGDHADDGDDRTDYEHDDVDRTTHVHAHLDTEQLRVAVDEEADRAVRVTAAAVEGEYAAEGRYRVEPGESLELATPEEPAVVRVVVETDDGDTTLEVTATYERYEVDCGDVRHGAVVATEVTYEWRTTVDGERRRWSRTVSMPAVDCPEPPADRPGHQPPERPGDDEPERPDRPEADDPEDRYDDARSTAHEAYDEANGTAGDGYGDGREAAWEAYERARDHLWSGYEDGREAFWDAYESVVHGDGGDGDPGETVNETVDDATSFGERVREDAEDDADRVREDAERTGERVREDAEDDADRVREDAEDDAERVRDDAEDDAERVRDDAETLVNETLPDDGDGDDGDGEEETVHADGSADVERNGTEVTARGAAEAGASAGGNSAGVEHETAVTAGLRP